MTRIFLDSANPLDAQVADRLLRGRGNPGVEGVTTNPTLLARYVAHSPHLYHKSLSHEDALLLYQDAIGALAQTVKGPISIQVIIRPETTRESILSQARVYREWIPNAVVKIPCTRVGLEAAEVLCTEGSLNITSIFTQEQAAAVYAATKNRGTDPEGKQYEVYVSPFAGKLDDKGENGMDLVANIIAMYKKLGDGHVYVLAASIRNIPHVMYAMKLNVDTITIPLSVIDQWCEAGCPKPKDDYIYDPKGVVDIPYREITLDNQWQDYDIAHDMTDISIAKYNAHWEEILKSHE